MKVGIIKEQLAVEWVPDLIKLVSRLNPDIEWVLDSDEEIHTQLLLDGDACYPFKKMVRSALSLLADVDALLLPRIINLDGFLMCPNFRALPDIITMNRDRIYRHYKAPILAPVMEISEPRHLTTLGAEISNALSKHDIAEHDHHFSGQERKTGDISERDISNTIAIIGHPYVVADARLNNGVIDILRTKGFDTVSSQDIFFDKLNELAASRDYYAKTLYWRSAREALGSFLYFTQVQRPAGIIHLVPFNCGVDALLRIEMMALHKKMDDAPPYMVIVCDEHSQRDHIVTRVEAFLDIVNGIKIR
jgi:predicted nucleotide-binding protein (sugar kinase/HSP70/actin superfamily)